MKRNIRFFTLVALSSVGLCLYLVIDSSRGAAALNSTDWIDAQLVEGVSVNGSGEHGTSNGTPRADTPKSGLAGIGYISDAPNRVWYSPLYGQSYDLAYPDRLTVDEHRFDPASGLFPWEGGWPSASITGYTSFNVDTVATAGADNYLIGGWAGRLNNEFVLEYWKLVPEVVATPVGSGQGQPILPPKRFERIQIYRGQLGVRLRGLYLDQEVRFCLAMMETSEEGREFYRFPIEEDADPVLIADSLTNNALDGIENINKAYHPEFGRLVLCYYGLFSPAVLIFFDFENDGVFDGEPLLGYQGHLPAIFDSPYLDFLTGPGYGL